MRAARLVALASLVASPAFSQQLALDSGAARPPTRISGTVLDADGRPMALAHVTLGRTSSGPIVVMAAGPDGRFALETDSTGALTLMFTGVDHQSKTVPLLLPDHGAEIALDVRLRTYPYNEDLSNVVAIGDFNGMSLSLGARKMEPQDDGTYVLDVEVDSAADSLAYQLMNTVGSGHSVNGTQSDWFVYDNGGDYRSVIRATGGATARIVFDPAELHRAKETVSVEFRDPGSGAARYARFVQRVQDAREPYFAEQGRLRDAKVSRDSIIAWSKAYDWSALDAVLDSALSDCEDQDLRTTLLAGYVAESPRVDTLTARMLLAEIPPESWKWTIGYSLLTQTFYATGQPDGYAAYALAVLRKHADRQIRADAVQHLLFQAARRKAQDQIDILYAWLVSEYPQSNQARYARTEFDPDRVIQVGRPVPAFSVTALEDSTVTYSNDSMKGKVYLMEFWAVWCGPCIGELPNLETVYRKYRDDGFTILSLSFDGRPEDVAKFRGEGEYPMPWLHAFVPGGFQSDLAKTFQVLGIPKPILIGADGSIVATGALRGEDLDKTLARILGRETPEGERKGAR